MTNLSEVGTTGNRRFVSRTAVTPEPAGGGGSPRPPPRSVRTVSRARLASQGPALQQHHHQLGIAEHAVWVGEIRRQLSTCLSPSTSAWRRLSSGCKCPCRCTCRGSP